MKVLRGGPLTATEAYLDIVINKAAGVGLPLLAFTNFSVIEGF